MLIANAECSVHKLLFNNFRRTCCAQGRQ